MIAEGVAVQAPAELAHVDVPIVGTLDVGHKQGRTTREGTMTVQKIDARWELQVYTLMAQSLQSRRAARDGQGPIFDPSFTIVLKYDDPEALGAEKWQLTGVRIWRLPLGFNTGDDIVQNEYPITWESEKPLQAFQAVKDQTGNYAARYVVGSAGS
jgi:hypothetical protein